MADTPLPFNIPEDGFGTLAESGVYIAACPAVPANIACQTVRGAIDRIKALKASGAGLG